MAPKLYMIPASPPARAVLMCANVLDIKLDLVPVNLLEKEQYSEEFVKKNPLHTIPVLEDDDFYLADSHAIMGYLVAKYGKDDALYPKNDYKKRAIIDQLLHFDTGTLFGRGKAIAVPLFYKDLQPTQEQLEALKEALQMLERILDQNKTEFVAGNSLSIADFSILTTVTFVNNFVPYSDFPNIVDFVKRIQKLPCHEVNKDGLANINARIQAKLKSEK